MLHHQQCANLAISHHFDCLIHGGVRSDRRNCPRFLLEYHTDCRCKFCHEAPRASNSTSEAQSRANTQKTGILLQQYHQDMQSFDALLREAEIAHGHLCAGQILGVRLAMLGCERLGIGDPKGVDRKRLVTFIEIDRCATDAIGVVTGCRLGKRALKLRDWGKMAATFVDLLTNRALRIAARESSKALAREMYPEIENKNQQQMHAYREMADADLFTEEW